MTVPSQTPKVTHTANGTTKSFAFTFRVRKTSHLSVYVDSTLKTLGTHYTVTSTNLAAGGTVVFVTAPANGAKVRIYRNMPYSRTDFDYQTSGTFPAATINEDLDALALQVQQIADAVSRSVSVGLLSEGVSTALPSPESLKFLRWNAAANALENATYNVDSLLVSAIHRAEKQTATDGQTVFNLTNSYLPGTNSLQVEMNNAILASGIDYTETSATSITLVDPAYADDFLVFKTISFVNSPASSAASVSFTPAYVGGVIRNMETVAREFPVNINNFPGASGNDITVPLLAAIASGAAIIEMAPGSFTYSSPLVIDRGIIFRGSGSCAGGTKAERVSGGATGEPGENTTKLTYIGTTGSGVEVVGSGIEGLENVHLSNFSLWGNASCDNGLVIGTGTVVSKSSFTNIHIKNFKNTGTDKGAGIMIKNCILTSFDNVYSMANNDGLNVYGIATTLDIGKMECRVNLRYGVLIQQLNGCGVEKITCESNGASGFVISVRNGSYVASLEVYQLYTEANCQSVAGPVIETRTNGTGTCIDVLVRRVNMYETLTGNVTRLIKFGKVDTVRYLDASLPTWASGFAECQSDTVACVISGRSGNYTPQTNVVNQGYDANGARRVLLTEGDPRTGTWSPGVVSGGTVSSWGTCRFIRDGNFMKIFAVANITNISGPLIINGLPFVPNERTGDGMATKVSAAVFTSALVDTDSTVTFNFSTTYSGGAVTCYMSATYYI